MYLLTIEQIKEFYHDLKENEFYIERKKDILHWYSQRLEWFSPQHSDSKNAEECHCRALADAIGFAYADDERLLCSCDPARTFTVLAIAAFLAEYHYPASFLTDDMRRDLESILKGQKTAKQKKFFSPTDYEEMIADERKVRKWFSR